LTATAANVVRKVAPSRRLSREAAAGLLLAAAAFLGVVSENIAVLRPLYDMLLDAKLTVAVGEAGISKPLLLWINDGLMAIFFLLVALEIKREVSEGALSTWKRAALPVYAAVGGMAVPALIFLGIVGPGSPEAKGWAIPAATDIAFALGVLSLFGNRVPAELKTFLLALAVVDDLGAIGIIALFYTSDLTLAALLLALLAGAGLLALNLLGVRRFAPYVLLGLVLWVCVLKSGVHATLAGVALGFAIPLMADDKGRSPAKAAEHGLHGWVAFMVMPLFAFANAGVPMEGLTLDQLFAPLSLAIMMGLFLGKQIGVFGFAYAAIKFGLAERPKQATLLQLYGVSLLAGIGFTMSLFIGSLAFADPEHQNLIRIGVISGSILSGLVGASVLAFAGKSDRVGVAVKSPELAMSGRPRS
jgi:NhaA family Na+:H+ antiporter